MSNPTADQRLAFEHWLKTEHPNLWPNPGENGQHWQGDHYGNRSMDDMWMAWCAALNGRLDYCPTCNLHLTQCGCP